MSLAVTVGLCFILAAMPQRRFPPPWSIENTGAAFVVKDSGGQKLGLFITKRSRGGNS
jgi:hypothetical protein